MQREQRTWALRQNWRGLVYAYVVERSECGLDIWMRKEAKQKARTLDNLTPRDSTQLGGVWWRKEARQKAWTQEPLTRWLFETAHGSELWMQEGGDKFNWFMRFFLFIDSQAELILSWEIILSRIYTHLSNICCALLCEEYRNQHWGDIYFYLLVWKSGYKEMSTSIP